MKAAGIRHEKRRPPSVGRRRRPTRFAEKARSRVSSIDGCVNDAVGRRTSMSRSGSAYPTSDVISYTYNDRSELTGASSNVDTAYSYSYAYDPIGNRITANEAGVPWTYTTNNLNQYTSATENNVQLNFAYDLDGGMTYRPVDVTSGWTQVWNGENRMVETHKGNDRLTFKYDYIGRRVEKCVYNGNTLASKTYFVYDGFKCVEELDALSNNAVAMRHAWQSFDVGLDTILATTDATDKISFCLHDANKDVMQKTDASGFLQENYAYAPFGENSGDASADIGFSSEVFEATIALSYYNYRYYAPSFCFWMRRDPIGEYNSNKIYLYVKNNPISNFDTLGLFCDDECSLGSIMMNDVYVKIGLWQNAEYPPDISDGVAGTIPIIMNIGNVLSIPVNPSTIAIYLVINIVDNSAIGSFSPDVEAMQQAIAKIGKEQYRNSGYVVWIYIDYNKCETKKCCPFFDLKHNIWKKQPSWKKVFSKDDSNISSPGGWSQEELTKSLFSRLTKQAVGSFWNDVKRK